MTSSSVFITGGTSGIGLELAKLYLEEGWRVGVCGRDLSKIPVAMKNHANLSSYSLDITNKKLLSDAIKNFAQGKLNLLIANAGIAIGNKTVLPDFSLAEKLLQTNVLGVLYSVEAALEIMLPQKSGHIAAIASVSGMIGLPGASAYCASKAAVLKMFESYALDLPHYGINVTSVAPGFIDTPLTRKNSHKMPFLLQAPEAAKKIKKAIDTKKVFYAFPWPMFIAVALLERLPRSFYRWLISAGRTLGLIQLRT